MIFSMNYITKVFTSGPSMCSPTNNPKKSVNVTGWPAFIFSFNLFLQINKNKYFYYADDFN